MTGATRDALELIRSLKKQYPDETVHGDINRHDDAKRRHQIQIVFSWRQGTEELVMTFWLVASA